MAFLIKDLMISVTQLGGLDQRGIGIAGGAGGVGGGMATSDHCTGPCCLNPCSMPSCEAASCISITKCSLGGFGNEVINPGDLAVLKQRLRIALAEVEARESAVRQEMIPKSEEEADLLERHLRGALEELKTIRSGIKRSPPTDG